MNWTWDPEKSDRNLGKHGVSFELAAMVFDDPFQLNLPDPFAYEDRWRTIGCPLPDRPHVLFVVHTWPDDGDTGRIISARRASAQERKAYENLDR